MPQKIIKDSVHGYISLDSLFAHIIDSAEFQRLKSIEQGSFRVLYPAARHDRFIHSLGTYHLAKLFAKNFISNIKDDLRIYIDDKIQNKILTTFYYAALLHDIGHAPFSHTTEKFFKKKMTTNNDIVINEQLINAVSKVIDKNKLNSFKKEFTDCAPSPHEIMSATILLEKSDEFLESNKDSIDLELAARMVIGCTFDYNNYKLETDDEKNICGIKNCFIRLLNSTTVDVDKMDYITRDTRMSGFHNVPIDIERLAKSVTAIRLEDGWLFPAFKKNAMSVIDNVFRAKVEQSLWMVSHPVVLYDSELLSYCINSLNSYIDKNYIGNVFSLEALGKDGITINDDKKYRLLNDIDINSDLRSFYDKSELIRELYERQSRRRPVWKSYYEYKYLFSVDKENIKMEEKVFIYFKGLIDYMKNSECFVLNEEKYIEISHDSNVSKNAKDAARFLKDFSKEENIPFDFALLLSSNSFSPKINPKLIFVSFGSLPKRNDYNYVTYEFLKGSSSGEDKRRLFYLYSKKKFSPDLINNFKNKLIENLNQQKKIPRV